MNRGDPMMISIPHCRFSGGLAVAALLACGAGSAAANEIQVPFSLVAGATSGPINVPAINTPISVTCVQNAAGHRGAGQMTLLRVGPPSALVWVGFDWASNNGVAATASQGSSATPGTNMLWCDFNKFVGIEVQSATAIQVKNSLSGPATGVINFVW